MIFVSPTYYLDGQRTNNSCRNCRPVNAIHTRLQGIVDGYKEQMEMSGVPFYRLCFQQLVEMEYRGNLVEGLHKDWILENGIILP